VYGSVSFKPIEEVFIRTGRVLHLHLSDGQTIRTTPEHPFWVEQLGWTPADVLKAGMRLATLAGEWVVVEEAYDTGEYETVYNCRVAEHHTYFVGDDTHVLAVWAHNEYTEVQRVAFRNEAVRVWKTRPINDQPVKISDWVYDWWTRWGKMGTQLPDHEKFAFGVANSLRRSGVTQDQVHKVLTAVCGLDLVTIGGGVNSENLVQAALEDSFAISTGGSRRLRFAGDHPRKDTEIGDMIRDRMAIKEISNKPDWYWAMKLTDTKQKPITDEEIENSKWYIWSIDPATKIGDYFLLYSDQVHVGHYPLPAVVWWNDGDPKHVDTRPGRDWPRKPNGAPGDEIRAWMNDPRNLWFQHGSHNTSEGPLLKARGYFWYPPKNPS
jgi:intein/homing endonuclease